MVLKHNTAKGDERTQPALDKLWIDIGAKDKADAERIYSGWGRASNPLQPAAINSLGNDPHAVRRWMQAGVYGATGVAEVLAASTPLDIAGIPVASVQEEFNIRGIIPVYDACAPTARLVLISPSSRAHA